MKWRRLNGDPIESLKTKVEETLIKEINQGHRMKVCIGTDSQVKGDNAEFACVIVFLREKKGGFMFINNYRMSKNNMSLKQRMILEVSRSVEVAYSLCDLFDKYDVELEIHADINTDPYFASNKALKEAMGYILGMGFVFKAKPDAFASSSCADKVV
jgi:predicted RNase H-related nuclease YkuK (DUF458 family)